MKKPAGSQARRETHMHAISVIDSLWQQLHEVVDTQVQEAMLL